MEDKNRNMYFKAVVPWTEIVWKKFLCLWSYTSILSLQVKPSSFSRLPNQKERIFVVSKANIPRDKNGLFPSAKEMVWGTDLGSGHSQDTHSLKDTRAIDTEKNQKFCHNPDWFFTKYCQSFQYKLLSGFLLKL